MDLSKIIEGKQRFASRKLGNELVLVPLQNSVASMDRMFTLSEVGAFIWERLQTGVTHDDLVAAIVEEFEIDGTTASADLNVFLSQLETLEHA